MKLSLLIVVVVAAGTTHSVPVPAPMFGIPTIHAWEELLILALRLQPGFSVATKLVSPFLAGSGSSGLASGSNSLKSLSSTIKKREESPESVKRSCPFLAGGSATLGSDSVNALRSFVKRDPSVKYKRACPFLARSSSSGLGSGSNSLKSLGSIIKKREESPESVKRTCPFLAGGSAKLGSDYVNALRSFVKRAEDAEVEVDAPSPEPRDHVKDPSIFNVTRRVSPSGSGLIPKDLNSTAVVSS
ncbi:BZ3500_MvSof-1268-A1-R1_Chr11-2g03398 [Microbotryum saponariae]|uniref:BZ3500_MvSof-1268-A1-R1_Chr11-2g03398 protein n=1 Tax=Microbotryum saponariae TaxID=289078 RepID=A0A2X0LC51_9BASI|nr:BZ3500_MvSof-1268-A1-R1_Chr11-2g03398 [Microbotryum saponariae]SDA03289.1 BZ3501_MvSof-1269-A2-R1_Chr11g02969 [Microbotryum saponariae]